jgi:hypothetical protein
MVVSIDRDFIFLSVAKDRAVLRRIQLELELDFGLSEKLYVLSYIRNKLLGLNPGNAYFDILLYIF